MVTIWIAPASPGAPASRVSKRDRSIRSKSASIDEATRFSPCLCAENNGLFVIRSVVPLGSRRASAPVRRSAHALHPRCSQGRLVPADHRALPALSMTLMSPLTERSWSGVFTAASSKAGDPTMTATHWAREIATLRRWRS